VTNTERRALQDQQNLLVKSVCIYQ
jgi:hypothetical protein